MAGYVSAKKRIFIFHFNQSLSQISPFKLSLTVLSFQLFATSGEATEWRTMVLKLLSKNFINLHDDTMKVYPMSQFVSLSPS